MTCWTGRVESVVVADARLRVEPELRDRDEELDDFDVELRDFFARVPVLLRRVDCDLGWGMLRGYRFRLENRMPVV
jgi:hypothetical protein